MKKRILSVFLFLTFFITVMPCLYYAAVAPLLSYDLYYVLEAENAIEKNNIYGEAIKIETTSNASGGKSIGGFAGGDNLVFTFNSPVAGNTEVLVRYSSIGATTAKFEIWDGAKYTIFYEKSFPATGAAGQWFDFQNTLITSSIHVLQGENKVRVTNETGQAFNTDCLYVSKAIQPDVTGDFPLSPTTMSLAVGETAQITAPQTAIFEANNACANVSTTGLVTAMKVGSCEIKVTVGEEYRIIPVNVYPTKGTAKLKTAFYEPFKHAIWDTYYTQRLDYNGSGDFSARLHLDGTGDTFKFGWINYRSVGTKSRYSNYHAVIGLKVKPDVNNPSAVVLRLSGVDSWTCESVGGLLGNQGIYVYLNNPGQISIVVRQENSTYTRADIIVPNILAGAFGRLIIDDFGNTINLAINDSPVAKIIIEGSSAKIYDKNEVLLKTATNIITTSPGVLALTCRGGSENMWLDTIGVMTYDENGILGPQNILTDIFVTNEEFTNESIKLTKNKTINLSASGYYDFKKEAVTMAPEYSLSRVEPLGCASLNGSALTTNDLDGKATLTVTKGGVSTAYNLIIGRILTDFGLFSSLSGLEPNSPLALEAYGFYDGSAVKEPLLEDAAYSFKSEPYNSSKPYDFRDDVFPEGALTLNGSTLTAYKTDGRAVLEMTVGGVKKTFVVTTKEQDLKTMRERLVAAKAIVSGNPEKDNDPNSIYYFDQTNAANIATIANVRTNGINAVNQIKDVSFEVLSKNVSVFKDGLLPSDYVNTTDSSISKCYDRLRPIAVAYITPGQEGYHNETYKAKLQLALKWLSTYWYNRSLTEIGNWYQWNIGAGMPLTDIMIMMHDFFTADECDFYMDGRKKYGIAGLGGTNEVWNAMSEIAEGLAANNVNTLTIGVNAIVRNMGYAVFNGTPGQTSPSNFREGFHPDGSHVAHGQFNYAYGYGQGDIDSKIQAIITVAGTNYDLSEELRNNIYQWMYDTYAPTMFKGVALHNMMGRDVSRGNRGTGNYNSAMQHMLMLASVAPTNQKDKIYGVIKGLILEGNTYSPSDTVRNIYNKIKNDNSIVPIRDNAYFKALYVTDIAVLRRPNYLATVAMNSKSIYNYESINNENLKAWYRSSGALQIYDNDITKFSDEQFPTIDSTRIPGTTIMPEKSIGIRPAAANSNSFTGVNQFLNQYGSAVYHYNQTAQGTTGYTTMFAKKSYFMFDDEVVAVGSDINSSENSMVETIVENQKIKENAAFMIDGVSATNKTASNPKYAFLEGATETLSDTGYYFPNPVAIVAKREARSGDWQDVNKSNFGTATRTYQSMVIEHGANPQNEEYAYVILPATTAEKTAAYAQNPDIKILKLTQSVHSVKETKLNVTGSNFFAPDTDDIISVDKPSSVMYKLTDSHLDLSACDPNKFSGYQSIKVTVKGCEILSPSTDQRISYQNLNGDAVITFQTYALMGKTLEASFDVSCPTASVPPAFFTMNEPLKQGENRIVITKNQDYTKGEYKIIAALYKGIQVVETKIYQDDDLVFAINGDPSQYQIKVFTWTGLDYMNPISEVVHFQ